MLNKLLDKYNVSPLFRFLVSFVMFHVSYIICLIVLTKKKTHTKQKRVAIKSIYIHMHTRIYSSSQWMDVHPVSTPLDVVANVFIVMSIENWLPLPSGTKWTWNLYVCRELKRICQTHMTDVDCYEGLAMEIGFLEAGDLLEQLRLFSFVGVWFLWTKDYWVYIGLVRLSHSFVVFSESGFVFSNQ